jgi:signal transduction histidine kinase
MDSPQQNQHIDLKGRKILVVDDDRLNSRILSAILKSEGYEVLVASSGEEALQGYDKFLPDLVLLDVIMPGINGFETCRELRKRHGETTAPVVFITAKSESDDVVEGLTAGGVDYLPKPFRAKEALARIRTHITLKLVMERQANLVDQLSKANAAKNKFLGMAAHDLRNPLASIRGLAEFLIDGTVGNLSPDQLDLIKTIHDASQSMLILVNELLDVATIESGELKLNPEQKDLVEIVEKSVYLSNIEAAKKNTKIILKAELAKAVLLIDSAKIRQVVDNLLSNAIKYSPPGSQIVASIGKSDKSWVFSVLDQGPGIPEDERDKLFKDFGRLSVKPTGGEKSTGLGLAICRKIIDAHKGTIEVENQQAGGCLFRVTLPL